MQATFSPAVDPAGLSVALLRVLRGLRRLSYGDPLDGPALVALHQVGLLGSVRLSDLAAELGVDLSTVSRQARALADTGLLERVDDPADRRASLITLTVAGQRAVADALARRQARLDALLADWPPADRSALAALLARLADDLAPARRG